MVKIRLKRLGRKNKPFFRVVVSDGRSKRDGKVIDEIGNYDPLLKTEKRSEKVSMNLEKYKSWISKGAQPTDIVRNLAVSLMKS